MNKILTPLNEKTKRNKQAVVDAYDKKKGGAVLHIESQNTLIWHTCGKLVIDRACHLE